MNEIILNFSDWMKRTTNLSDSSIYKYSRAVISVSNDMAVIGVIRKSLINMNIVELDIAIQSILKNSDFIIKNKRGNNMYSNSLKQFRSYIKSLEETSAVSQTITDVLANDTHISVTERENLIKSRVGQGIFRTSLIKKYNGTCVVTGITLKSLLIASHIKPWAVSTNSERLSTENGLLLSANYDRLFDSGLISFDSNRKIIISRCIDNENRRRLNLTNDITANIILSNEMKLNLEYHRDVVFLK